MITLMTITMASHQIRQRQTSHRRILLTIILTTMDIAKPSRARRIASQTRKMELRKNEETRTPREQQDNPERRETKFAKNSRKNGEPCSTLGLAAMTLKRE